MNSGNYHWWGRYWVRGGGILSHLSWKILRTEHLRHKYLWIRKSPLIIRVLEMCVAYLTTLSLKVNLFLVHSKNKGPNTVSFHLKAVECLRGPPPLHLVEKHLSMAVNDGFQGLRKHFNWAEGCNRPPQGECNTSPLSSLYLLIPSPQSEMNEG